VGASRREGTFALEGKGQHCEFLASLEALRGSVFKIASAPHYSQHNVYARFHFGLWAGTVYVPSAVTALAEAAGRVGPAAAQLASRATMLVAFATILGCLLMPWLAERLGRRGALAFYFALMLIFVAFTFGKVFYLGPSALPFFFVCLFFLGFGGANFAVYTLWLPEQYPTECRASAFAFSTSFARFGGAGITFLVGAGVQHYGSLGVPVALTSLAFALACC